MPIYKYIFRIYIGGTYCDSSHRIVGNNVIITGGASGIGFETAKELVKRGNLSSFAGLNNKKS